MLKKTLQEMNLLDDYLFGTMVDDPTVCQNTAAHHSGQGNSGAEGDTAENLCRS